MTRPSLIRAACAAALVSVVPLLALAKDPPAEGAKPSPAAPAKVEKKPAIKPAAEPASADAAAAAAKPAFAEPALSPDGSEIAFVHAGDIWVVPATGGVAHLLVSHPAAESRPLFSPDGKRLAFVSNRTGNGDIYILTFATGDVKRLTFDDGNEQLDAWSADGKYVYFSSTVNDLGAGNADVYRVRSEGGTPMPVSAERYANEAQSAPSPDGKILALAGNAHTRDWWRNGHSNWNETHVWLRRERKDKPAAYEELTPQGTREMWPMWSADAHTVYAVSDSDKGGQNIVAYDLTAKGPKKSTPVTHFEDGRVLWPNISPDGRTIVFERDFGIWKVSTAGGSPERLSITLRGAPTADVGSPVTFTGGFRDLAVSPDGKKVAFVVHGEVFAASARDGGRAVRVTDTPEPESQVEWAPDSRRIVYVSARGPGAAQTLQMYDFGTQAETSLTKGDVIDASPHFAPDGKSLVFRRNGTELRALDLATKKDTLLVGGLASALPPFDDSPGPFAFSPKGQWLAYVDTGKRGFDNVYVLSLKDANPKPQQVTFFANTGSNAVSWSGDGRSLLFGTGMRTEDYQLARVDLVSRPPNFTEDQFRGLFDEDIRTIRPGGPRGPFRVPGPERRQVPPITSNTPGTGDGAPATRPTDTPESLALTRPTTVPATAPAVETFDFANVRRRVAMLSVGVDVDTNVVSPDGKWCAFVGSAGGKQNVYAYPLDTAGAGDAVVRQLTTTAGGKSSLRFAPDSREVYYLEGGQIRAVEVASRTVREVNVTAPMELDFAREKGEVFRQAWKYLKLNFYDERMHGRDWAAVRDRLMPYVNGARTADELRRVVLLMVGDLNASHTGVGSPRTGGGANVGRLGLRYDRATYEKDGLLKVTEVLPQSPAEQAGIKIGEHVLAVDGAPVDAEANLDQYLDRKIGRRVVLKVAADPMAANPREVPVRPVDLATERTQVYKDWVERNRAYVAKASNGRLGYVHIPDMGNSAVARLTQDLDAEAATRDGVVVDVRANVGGFASPYVLDVLSRRGYLTIGRRGAVDAPGRMYVGQRALDLPTVLVTNNQSVSDAENFTEGYRALKLGKVVGQSTAGGVIFTSDVTLMDGTSLRIPFSKVTNREGQSLEGAGRAVDVKVRRPLGEAAAGKDSQLDAAVREMLKQVDKGKEQAKPAEKKAEPARKPAEKASGGTTAAKPSK